MEYHNRPKSKFNISLLVQQFGWFFVFFYSTIGGSETSAPSSSDKYCGYLQNLQARVFRESEKPGPIESILDFVNSLVQKVSLEKIEGDAIQQKMSFEQFQQWAKEKHSLKVSDHYKPKYLDRYMKEVCGVITNSATFGAEHDPEMGVSAEKQFDPKGHPYSDDMLKNSSDEPDKQTTPTK